MGVNDILAMSWSRLGQLLVNPTLPGTINGIAFDEMRDFDMLPPLHSLHEEFFKSDDNIYVRVIKAIDRYTLLVTSFTVSTGSVNVGVIDITSAEGVTKIEDPKIIQLIVSNNSTELRAATAKPGATPKYPYPQQQAIADILDSVFPERWDMLGEKVIIHFPEVNITYGSIQHKMHDLFVRIPFTYNYSAITGTLEGLRMTLTPAEVAVGYRHSHLPTNDYRWRAFCLGHTYNNRLMQDLICKLDLDNFFILLHQIDNYVRWESKDGGPHISIDHLRQRNSTGEIAMNDFAATFHWPNMMEWCRHFLLCARARPHLFTATQNVDGTVCILLDTTNQSNEIRVALDLTAREHGVTSFSFDEARNVYLGSSRTESSDYANNRGRFLQTTPFMFRGAEVKPHVLDDPQQAQRNRAYRANPYWYHHMITTINYLLNAN